VTAAGQCNDLARAAIRVAFHDCASWERRLGNGNGTGGGGCDGSLFLAGEYTRAENAGLERSAPQLGAMAKGYGVGVADFFQFAAGELFFFAQTKKLAAWVELTTDIFDLYSACGGDVSAGTYGQDVCRTQGQLRSQPAGPGAEPASGWG
jgi:hypothetical protein